MRNISFRPHVCVICYPNYPSNKTGRGQDRYSYELLKQLRLLGMDTIALVQGTVNNFLEYVVKDFWVFLRTINIKADLFHAASEYGAKYLWLTKKFPLVTTIHDMLPYFFFSKAPTLYSNQLVCFKLASKSDRIILSSNFYVGLVRRILRVPPERISVVHHGVDHELFRPVPKNHLEQKDRKIVLYVGGLNRLKGVDTLLRAFSIVAKEMNDVDLFIVGKGRDFTLLQAIVNALGIRNRVRFLGFVKEQNLPKYYNLADVFVWPSHFGVGLQVLETMACGTPAIAGDTLDTPEYVGNGGVLFRVGDANHLASIMLEILMDDGLREELGRKALQWANSFSWERTARETVNVYREVLRAK